MKQRHPVVERYMRHLETTLSGLDPVDRREVLQEIRNHIAEATAAGRPLDVVIESLGPADALGRAYAIELLFHPHNDRRHVTRWLSIVGLIVVLSIPTFVAVVTLGSIGISFVGSGLFVFVIGLLEVTGVHLPWVGVSDVSPVVGIVLGPTMVILGLISLVALRLYIRFVVRAVRSALPPVRTPHPPSEYQQGAST